MFQIQIPKQKWFGSLGIGIWCMFGIWNLGFGISNNEPSSLMIRLYHGIGKKQLA
jgi:hypothetical protein